VWKLNINGEGVNLGQARAIWLRERAEGDWEVVAGFSDGSLDIMARRGSEASARDLLIELVRVLNGERRA
jgi:hypothetical protein